MSAFYKTGLHVGECTCQFMGQSSSEKKTPYLGLKFLIKSRVEGEREIAVESSERTVYLYLSDGALEMTIDAVAHLGYDKDSLKFLDPAQNGFFNFAGQICDLWCKVEDYKGDSKEKWSISLPRKPVEPPDEKELRRLDSLFGKAIRARRGPGIPSAAQSPAATSTLERKGNGEILGVSDTQRNAAGAARADMTAPPTVDEIPF